MTISCDAKTTYTKACGCRISDKNRGHAAVKDRLGFTLAHLCSNHMKVLCSGKSVSLRDGRLLHLGVDGSPEVTA